MNAHPSFKWTFARVRNSRRGSSENLTIRRDRDSATRPAFSGRVASKRSDEVGEEFWHVRVRSLDLGVVTSGQCESVVVESIGEPTEFTSGSVAARIPAGFLTALVAPRLRSPTCDPLTIGALGVGIVSLSLRPAVACSDGNRRVGPAGSVTRRFRCRA